MPAGRFTPKRATIDRHVSNAAPSPPNLDVDTPGEISSFGASAGQRPAFLTFNRIAVGEAGDVESIYN